MIVALDVGGHLSLTAQIVHVDMQDLSRARVACAFNAISKRFSFKVIPSIW